MSGQIPGLLDFNSVSIWSASGSNVEIHPNTFISGTAGLPTRPTGFHNSHKFDLWRCIYSSRILIFAEILGINSTNFAIFLIEEEDGKITAYEFKWNPEDNPPCPKAFAEAYPEASFKIINPTNLDEFLL